MCGPFKDVKEFHERLITALMQSAPRLESRYLGRLPDDDEVGFVNADISDENILVDEATGEITAILDWEMAEVWTVWWEYRKAMHGSRRTVWWWELLQQVMAFNADAVEADMDLERF